MHEISEKLDHGTIKHLILTDFTLEVVKNCQEDVSGIIW